MRRKAASFPLHAFLRHVVLLSYPDNCVKFLLLSSHSGVEEVVPDVGPEAVAAVAGGD
jgi:hypothetical protein